jgi:CheY-like chemotaxis protein
MSKENSPPADVHVLIVDDDQNDLAILEDAFRALSEGNWKIHAVPDVAQALQTIQTGKIQLVVLAVNSAALDVSLLLGSFSQHHSQFKTVVVAATATAETRAASLAAGVDLFLEKPVSPEGLKAVFANVSKLVGWELPPDFRGGSPGVGLADLIQMECLARNSSVIELFRESSLGRIYLEDGQIIHAVCGEISGERAFQKLFTLTGAIFELLDFETPPERTINRTWEFLLGEVARRREAPPAGMVDPVAGETAAPPAAKPVEMLIAAPAGEVFYQWQCPDSAARLKLLQEINLHAEPLTTFLQIGKLDRVEIQLPDGRAILQARADRLIFIRTTNPETHEG